MVLELADFFGGKKKPLSFAKEEQPKKQMT